MEICKNCKSYMIIYYKQNFKQCKVYQQIQRTKIDKGCLFDLRKTFVKNQTNRIRSANSPLYIEDVFLNKTTSEATLTKISS